MGKGLKHKARSSPTRKDYGRETNSIAKKDQGGDFVPFRLPLAESRGGASGGVWGNAPTVPRQINSKGTANKGRRQRSVPASNFARPQTRPPSCSFDLLCCVAPDGRDRIAGLATIDALSRTQRISRLRTRQGGFAVAPLTPSPVTSHVSCSESFQFFVPAGAGIILFPDKNAPRCAANFSLLANVNETQRSSATLSGMNGRQNGKGASRWCR